MIGLERGAVRLVEYQDDWRFEAARTVAELKDLLGEAAIDVQHVGSTAIPSVHAKPIIDIAVGVHDLDAVLPYIETLNRNQYIFRGKDVPRQLLFVKGDFGRDIRTHHIHVVKWNGNEWNNYIDLRDYLNAVPSKAMIYDACKMNLARRFPQARACYTEGKQELISELLGEASAWRAQRQG